MTGTYESEKSRIRLGSEAAAAGPPRREAPAAVSVFVELRRDKSLWRGKPARQAKVESKLEHTGKTHLRPEATARQVPVPLLFFYKTKPIFAENSLVATG
jgi:hypothetical protein